MNLLKNDLEAYGTRPVWFNAWHHQNEDQLLAALLQAIRTQAVPGLSPAGWMFRVRLAWARLCESWFETALLIAAVVLVWRGEAYARANFANFSIGHLAHLAVLRMSLDPAKVSFAGLDTVFKFAEHWIATFAGALFAIRKGVRGITAFASNPASLLSATSAGTSVKQLEQQTSFRESFASEFSDVTAALGRRRMLILIDDLDRCRPEKVREVLEAVNFLVSSGECFIVLGMARDIVEHCVGLSFAAVVDTMPWDAFDLSPEEVARISERARQAVASKSGSPSPSDSPDSVAIARRLAFAHLFLDKLVQIEVSIPAPTPAQKRLLFVTDEERLRNEPGAEQRVQQWLRAGGLTAQFLQPVAKMALVAVVVIGLGLQVGRGVGRTIQLSDRTDAGAQQEGASSPQQQQQPLQGSTSPVIAVPTPKPFLLDSAPTLTTGWLATWPFCIAVVGFVVSAFGALRRLPMQVVRDEAPFASALAAWHPLVLTSGARNTPRAARRFQNYVRYLAMRQRAVMLGPQIALGERLLRQGLRAPLPRPRPLVIVPNRVLSEEVNQEAISLGALLRDGIAGASKLASVTETGGGLSIQFNSGVPEGTQQLIAALAQGDIYIPEPILVALAAVDAYSPEFLADLGDFRSYVAESDRGPLDETMGQKDTRVLALSEAIARHRETWRNWYNLEHYRTAYLKLCADVDPTSWTTKTLKL
jgi:hypothetical protein